MKRFSIFLLLAAFFLPLAMNAQTRRLRNSFLGSTKTEMSTQNEVFVKSPVQIPNLESSKFSLGNSDNTMGGRGTRDVIYEPVLTSQTDWSGNYVLAVPLNSTTAYAFGEVDSDDHSASIEAVTMDANYNITSIGNASVLTIAESSSYSGYYTIQINGGDYLADGTNGLETSSTETNYTNWDISLTSDGMEIYNPIWSGGPYYLYFLLFTDTSTNQSGAFWLTDDGTTYYDGVVEGYTFEYILPYLYKETTSGGNTTDCNSITFSDVCTNQQNVNGSSFQIGDASSVSFAKNNGTNNPTYYTTGASVRVYPKNSFTVTSTYNIVSINLTFGSGDNTNTITASTGTYSNGAWTGEANSVTFTVGGTKNHRRIAAIEVCVENPCPAPTNLTYSNVTGEGATLAWDGEADSYSIHIGPAPKTYDFEDGSLQGWSAVDNDGDGDSWYVMDNNTYSGSHGGDYYVFVEYNESSAVDDWLISPQVQLGGSISFWIKKLNNSSYHDYYRVYVSTTNTDISSFSEITSGTIEPATSYSKVSYDLSSYSGAGYIAIRHTAAADQAYLFVDDITITEGGQTIPNVTSPYTVTGLNPATEYVWQVMGDCGDGDVSQWSTSSTFTTLDLCAAPTGLSSADATNNSVSLSWTGYTDAYNIQYREVDPTAPATVILTAGDVWGDGSGYQMLLDADATAYGTIIPEIGSDYGYLSADGTIGGSTGNVSSTVYDEFEYKIPVNADGALSTQNIVINNSISIEVPAGTYDWCITNPTPNDRVWIAGTSGNVGGRQNDYVFEAGKTYEFVVSKYGTGDGVDVTITADWTTVPGTVTSPYTLTGLNPGTTYAWQVQGEGCDNWSSTAYFTTLAGTLVETITPDPIEITLLPGETANFSYTVAPSDATNQTVTITSGDATVATVDDINLVVTGVAPGNTTITIAANDGSGVIGTINVTVNAILVDGITASDVTVVNGETATISYTVSPSNATDPSVTFTSANTAIATVDANGEVTGVGVGTTTITITSVSNPDVTATVTVTVTSNPDAVQFTVNVPANAAPGDVITVEGVLTAPTNGTYEGFTDLLMRIFYDNTAFEYVANSMVYGPVATQAQQYGSQLTPNTTYIANAIQLGINCYDEGVFVTADGVVFSAQFTVLEGTEGSFTFTAQPKDELNFDHEGVSIPYEVTPSTVTIGEELYHTFIEGYGTSTTGNYYLIASPIGSVAPTAVVDLNDRTRKMTDGSFDLYYFDNNEELEWINYKRENNEINPNFGNLTPGKGYLYANSQNIELAFIGQAYTGSGDVTLTISETNQYMANWNLVGNPFAETAYIADGRDFYTMQSNGTLIAKVNQDQISIQPMEGIFVKANSNNETITFTTTAPANNGKGLVLDLFQGNGLIDRAVVRFGEGQTLPKFQIKKNSTKVYIPMEGEDYAVVRSEEVGEMPVSFKAEENGSYTLSFSALNAEFGYLHLIDNMTGNDIDLLATPNYNFTAKTTDYENRFKLVFATGSNDDDSFAFFSNGSFIISNEGNAMLQVIDVNGRILSSENINGSANVNVNAAAGTYMLRLINGDNVKVQKVVVR